MSAWGEMRPDGSGGWPGTPPDGQDAPERDGEAAQGHAWPGLPVPCRKCTGRGDAHFLTCPGLRLPPGDPS